MKRILVFLFVVLSLVSCKKRKTATQAELDEKIITNYISDNKLNATATGSGLYYVITTQGTGAQPNANSNVTVNYKGSLKDGTVFDQSAPVGITFNLNSVIKGWQEGIPYFKKGGKGVLLIPSALGYGANATGSIPANSVLIFDIELLNVN
ncbi:MAG: FKBP-type peptidyl-prolyl cis-trans isomerase [Bacteroidota bacterium]|nr:FKBP-type peptidyl-prolyl cis-trans isomerase [Bacteroidota bacterium]